MPIDSALRGLNPAEIDDVVGLLILRHLHDGGVIDYPLRDDHPAASAMAALMSRGLVAMWDRIWPLHDRYRLTPAGMEWIEATYRPGRAEAVFQELRAAGIPVEARGRWLEERGHDPLRWPAVHDPYVNWDSWTDDPGVWFLYVHDAHAQLREQRREKERRREREPDIDDLDFEAGRHHAMHGHGVPHTDVS